MERKGAQISLRVPLTLKELIQEFIARDTHINESDFVRSAIREKIKSDAPELYQNLFREG